MRVPVALTGPAAASAYGFDGFRNLTWAPLWCSPRRGPREAGVIRTRAWMPPNLMENVSVAHPLLVLRHLGTEPSALLRREDDISAADRIELAVEHALRSKFVELAELTGLGGAHPGDRALVPILRGRRHEPPAESYAETRAIQLLRSFGHHCWRQMLIFSGGRAAHRVDLVIPFRRMHRPEVLLPSHGLLVEIDSREFHEHRFEEDHRRETTYDMLGFHWVSFTPNQIEHQPQRVRRSVEASLQKMRPMTIRKTPHQAKKGQ